MRTLKSGSNAMTLHDCTTWHALHHTHLHCSPSLYCYSNNFKTLGDFRGLISHGEGVWASGMLCCTSWVLIEIMHICFIDSPTHDAHAQNATRLIKDMIQLHQEPKDGLNWQIWSAKTKLIVQQSFKQKQGMLLNLISLNHPPSLTRTHTALYLTIHHLISALCPILLSIALPLTLMMMIIITIFQRTLQNLRTISITQDIKMTQGLGIEMIWMIIMYLQHMPSKMLQWTHWWLMNYLSMTWVPLLTRTLKTKSFCQLHFERIEQSICYTRKPWLLISLTHGLF